MNFHISFFSSKGAPLLSLLYQKILKSVVNLAANKISDSLADKFESDIQRIIQGVLDDLDPSTFL